MASKGAIVAGVIIGGVVLGGLIYLIVKSSSKTTSQTSTVQKRLATANRKVPELAWPSGFVADDNPDIPKILPEVMEQFEPKDGTFYLNKEKWHIEWNEDGLPTDITIERNARRQ